MLKTSRLLTATLALMLLLTCAGCGEPSAVSADQPVTTAPDAKAKKTYQDLIVGYVQLGDESDWRSANTASVKEAAAQLGVELRFSNAQQKQENQIQAIRSLIAQKVDVIGVAPLVETGWTAVFKEAKDAGIPIILVDRRAAVPADLYVTFMGSDFLEEGRNAGRIMAKLTDGQANIVELQGTNGSAPANDRYVGFREILQDYPGMKIIDSQDGELYRRQGQGSDGGLPESSRQEHHRPLCPQ